MFTPVPSSVFLFREGTSKISSLPLLCERQNECYMYTEHSQYQRTFIETLFSNPIILNFLMLQSVVCLNYVK